MLNRATIERMAAKAGGGPILIALSGGGDSVALLHLLVAEFGAARLHACVVDHALRDGSGANAVRGAGFAERLGVRTSIETLHWSIGANRAHEAAREARYAVLCRAAQESGARVIVTGHTRDDQAETVLIRAARGSGLRGLAGMRAIAPVPVWPEGRGLSLCRPLLDARRANLRTYLRDQGADWIEDPANTNEAYARVRARQTLAALEQGGLDPMRLAAIAEKLAPLAEALDIAAFDLIQSAARFDVDAIGVDPSRFQNADEAVRQRALFALIAAAGGHARGPASGQVADLDAALALNFTSATLAGALIRKRGNRLSFTRDRGALEGRADGTPPVAPLVLSAGEEAVWDRRLALTAREPGWSVAFENGATLLARGEERTDLAAASPHWLIKDRVRHVLGRD
jgi:tRNA(Ile)-lysidine synthase